MDLFYIVSIGGQLLYAALDVVAGVSYNKRDEESDLEGELKVDRVYGGAKFSVPLIDDDEDPLIEIDVYPKLKGKIKFGSLEFSFLRIKYLLK